MLNLTEFFAPCLGSRESKHSGAGSVPWRESPRGILFCLPHPQLLKDAQPLPCLGSLLCPALGSETNTSPGMFLPSIIRTRAEPLTALWSTGPSALEGHGLYLVYVCDFPEAPRFLTVSQSRPVAWDVSGKWPTSFLQGQRREARN